MKKNQMEYRIRFDENYNGRGEFFVFEYRSNGDDEWNLDSAFKVLGDEADGMISYQALTKIRHLMDMGIHFRFI